MLAPARSALVHDSGAGDRAATSHDRKRRLPIEPSSLLPAVLASGAVSGIVQLVLDRAERVSMPLMSARSVCEPDPSGRKLAADLPCAD
jgi:hypothetical protein